MLLEIFETTKRIQSGVSNGCRVIFFVEDSSDVSAKQSLVIQVDWPGNLHARKKYDENRLLGIDFRGAQDNVLDDFIRECVCFYEENKAQPHSQQIVS